MKFYKPLFSIIIIIIQLILSIISYNNFVDWRIANSELSELISPVFYGDSLFLFVLIIGFYEMQTKLGWFKNTFRLVLMFTILGTQLSGFIPIDQFYYGIYNIAWFLSLVAIVLIFIRFGKYGMEKLNNRKSNITQK